MVCRENKARSAVMGYSKRLLANAGFADYSDFEVQSMLHQMRHPFEAYTMPEPMEYVAFLKGTRQMIVDDPTISDADKYRQSKGRGSQPGLVTRIDEELERYRTGKLPNGRKLTNAQMNIGADFAAMQRLAQPLARAQEAKTAYVEMYARHMGISADEATNRYRDLVNRRQSDRMNTQISLADDWKDKLAMSGITAEQQADMGQSNQAREALRIMEAERQQRIATYPRRSAFTAENTTRFVRPEQVAGKEQCIGGCGQFGHSKSACPNQQLVADVNAAEDRARAAADKLAAANTALAAAQLRSDIDSGLHKPGDAVEFQNRMWQAGDPNLTAAINQHADQVPPVGVLRNIIADARKTKTAAQEAQQRLDSAVGPIPQVSDWLQSVSYNRDTGALAVRTAPYRLKDGTERPAKTYIRQMPVDEYDRMAASADFGSQISNSIFARASVQKNASDRYNFHNRAEAEAATQMVQCPTCGQFASFTTGHQCPVTGSRDTKEQHRLDEQRRINRERAEIAKLPAPPVSDNTPRHRVLSQTRIKTPEDGFLSIGHPHEASRIVNNGGVALGRMSGSYLGANVTADTYTWNDPGTGRKLARVAATKCSCGQKECRHVQMAVSTFANANRAQLSTAQPGGRDMADADRAPVASNPFPGDPQRESYARIRARRAAGDERLVMRSTQSGPHRVFVMSPTIGGQPTAEQSIPTTWSGPSGATVDTRNPNEVAAAIGQRLNQHGGEWMTNVDSLGGVWVRDRNAYESTTRRSSKQARETLREVFGVNPGPRADLYVPPSPSWRIELLDKAHGVDSGVRGGRPVASTAGADPIATP